MRTDPPLSTFPAVGLPAAIFGWGSGGVGRESAEFHLNVDAHFRVLEFSVCETLILGLTASKTSKTPNQERKMCTI